jgi:hypothetical protein
MQTTQFGLKAALKYLLSILDCVEHSFLFHAIIHLFIERELLHCSTDAVTTNCGLSISVRVVLDRGNRVCRDERSSRAGSSAVFLSIPLLKCIAKRLFYANFRRDPTLFIHSDSPFETKRVRNGRN